MCYLLKLTWFHFVFCVLYNVPTKTRSPFKYMFSVRLSKKIVSMSASLKTFNKKAPALKALKPGQVLCNKDITQYIILDNYAQLGSILSRDDQDKHYYEFIPSDVPVKLYLDIEIYQDKQPFQFEHHQDTIRDICTKLRAQLAKKYKTDLIKCIVLESHGATKRSYHIIGLLERNNEPVYFENVKVLKKFISTTFKTLTKDNIVDLSVYREGLFRTYLSTKSNENRPLVKANGLSDDFGIMDTFVCSKVSGTMELIEAEKRKSGSASSVTLDNSSHADVESSTCAEIKDADISCIKKFVKQKYNVTNKDIREVVLDQSNKCIVIALNRTFCHNVDREHKSNHQYIIIDAHSSKQKCHDTECREFKHNELGSGQYPKELREIVARVLNENPDTLINSTIEECKEYITENFDDNVQEILFDRQDQVFRGNASENALIPFKMGACSGNCKFEHHINNNGYCLRCSVCNAIFPKKHMIRVDDRYKNLSNFWVKYTQLVNNGTVNINIYYNKDEEFTCDVNLDPAIFEDKDVTYLYNHILDGHKITMIGELFSILYSSCVYANDSWYYFNGTRWVHDDNNKEMKKNVIANSMTMCLPQIG
jgi:Herpesviridae UL52/UL70 DNA primase